MSTITVQVPEPLRELTGDRASFTVEAENLDQVFHRIRVAEPLLAGRIFDEDGTLRGFVNLYLDGRDVRHLRSADRIPVSRARLAVVPSVAGG